ncbi:MAG: aminopeptidase N [Plesiomonas sp.]
MTQQPQAKYRHDYQAPDYTITQVELAFNLAADNTCVTATSDVLRQGEHTRPLVLAGEGLTLVSVAVDGQPWPHYQQSAHALTLSQLPEHFTLTVVTTFSPANNTALSGLYQSGEALCTQCEAEGFRRITYFLDRPDVLARYRTKITADKERYPFLLSNGNRIAHGDLPDGKHWMQWEDPFPKPSYLFALVAGDFDVLRDTFVTRSGRDVALELYVDRGNLDRADWAMASLKQSMAWDEARFGLEYDLDIYMIVAVDFFNMGAMENKGLNVFNSKFVLAKAETATDADYLDIERVIGHEYFHNWTGNRVTCRDWFQLSLKEGLTVFRDQEFSSDLGSRAVNRINNVRVVRGAQFAEDASPMAHPIRPDKVIEMNNFYTVTVYEKGSEVIRMMHTLLGEAAFQAGMRLYFERHDGSAATCDDFVDAMQQASGVDLTQFRRWYSQAGTPQLTVHDEYDAATQVYTLHVSQMTPPTPEQAEKLPLHIPLNIELYSPQGEVIPLMLEGKPVGNVLSVTEALQTFRFEQVAEQPVISLLREFSAPVKLDYPYTDAQLTFLMRYASNDFARWDAAQMLIGKYVRLNVANVAQGAELIFPLAAIDAFRAILLDDSLDPALAALILTLPKETELAELFDTIDPDAIRTVREFIREELVLELADELRAVYQAHQLAEYRVEHGDIARRSLRNTCLSYLAFAEGADARVRKQYETANNMTDALAALSAAVSAELPCRDALMTHFADKWQHDGLVMDKWFMLQATSPAANVLATVRTVMQHPAFSLANPNRTRSLIGAFASANPAAFHAKDGAGYQFLGDILAELNSRNPQVASRLIEPLIRLGRYDADRQALMRTQLVKLQGLDNLASDLFEKISKSLA